MPEYEMSQEFANQIMGCFQRLVGQDCGSGAISFRPNYSGRGMYGKKCAGFVIEHGMEVSLGIAIREAALMVDDGDADILAEVIAQFGSCGDSMGQDKIVYFPNISCPDASNQEDA